MNITVMGYMLFFVTCVFTALLSCAQRTITGYEQGCNIAKYNEIQHLRQDVMTMKELIRSIADKMDDMSNKVNGITEKLETIDAISNQLNDIAADVHVPSAYKTGYRVHHFQSPLGSYRYSYAEGVARCLEEGMKIATPQQLQVAWQQGMNVCACGWLSDGSNRYPIQYPHPGCGGTTSGVITCSYTTVDVYCYH